eukprot:scaffold333_cov133-Cylindrotheca_fusiformis.AAC.21
MSLNQLVYDYIEWQVEKHNRGEKVLAVWQAEFPKENGAQGDDGNGSNKYAVVKKGGLRAPALFFHKEDALSFVSSVKDGKADMSSVNVEEFPSMFTALHSVLPHSSSATHVEEAEDPRTDTGESEPSSSGSVASGASDSQPEEDSKVAPTSPNEDNALSSSSAMKTISAEGPTTTAPTSKEDLTPNSMEATTKSSRKHLASSDSLQTMFPSPKRQKLDESCSTEVEKKEASSGSNSPSLLADQHPNYRLKNALWEQRYHELAAYWDGETTVYQSQIAENKSLTNWVKHQRKCYKRGNVAPDRLKLLDDIGFKWVGRNSVVLSTQPNDEADIVVMKQPIVTLPRTSSAQADRNDSWSALWDLRFSELLDYKRRFGDTKVPKDWPENRKLAGWVRKQREQYRKQAIGENVSMTPERKQKLISIGFVWSLRPGRLKHPLPPLPESQPEPHHQKQECIMGKEEDRTEVEPYFVDNNGHLII